MFRSWSSHRIFIKHSSFLFCVFTGIFLASRTYHGMSISRLTFTSLGDLELGGSAGLDSGLDS